MKINIINAGTAAALLFGSHFAFGHSLSLIHI